MAEFIIPTTVELAPPPATPSEVEAAPAVPAPAELLTLQKGRLVFTRSYWSAIAERAVKTFAQTMVAALGIGATGAVHLDWRNIGALSGAAAVASVLTSLSGLSAPQPPAKDAPQG